MATNNHTADENGVLIGVERVQYADSSIVSATATVVNVAPAREGGVTRAASATTSNRTRAEFNGNSQIIKLVNRWSHGPSAHLYTTSAVAVSQLVLHSGTEWMALADGGVKKLNRISACARSGA